MNSKSKSFNCDCSGEIKHDSRCCNHEHCDCLEEFNHNHRCCNCAHCTPGHPTPTESLFTCGQGSGVSIPIPTLTSPQFAPLPVASVTLDTTCLCNPSVKIDFNSIINYQALIGTATILTTPFTVTFQLSKTCGDGAKVALGTWDYSFGAISLAVNVTNSFGFTHCECNTCPACCVYNVEIVRVTGASLLNVAAAVTLTENASIRSSNITATATSH
ncbi:DUF4489 domain-containing protein [Clostridium frigidicarnis]|uniref:DUF4489 domain-containing protein n=1 Tax=Clostridium frigidicarnis TaxID=84698 RepID=A0A1I0X6Q0_9CLOT|nr:DUF4489 domain-containing protein [Clostridium frigidicarnis]SFA96732.1 protein of unknown function [Clostridium frigidicarnis]